MSSLECIQKQCLAWVLVAVTALVGMASCVPVDARADQLSGVVSSEYAFGNGDCSGGASDPIGVLFRGKRAGVSNVARETEAYTGWEWAENPNKQGVKVNTGGEYKCRETDAARASQTDVLPLNRNHVRFIPATFGTSDLKTVGTPHHEDFVVHNPLGGDHCQQEFINGNHAVDSNGKEGSGFDVGRQRLKRAFRDYDHKVEPEKWGNTESFEQCDEDFAASDGWGVTIWINTGFSGITKETSLLKPTSSKLNGRLVT